MSRKSLNALQAILIRERLILYLEHRRLTQPGFSVRALIEAVIFSEANAASHLAYREEEDTGARYDSGLPLKNNTIGNLLTRKVSATGAENLPLLRDFLIAEGFVSPRLLVMASAHPDHALRPQFAGIASTDPRLQRHRYLLEGEYLRLDGDAMDQLWIAAPGRSKPFVTLRAICPWSSGPGGRPSLKSLNHDSATPRRVYEGRIFLMPGESPTLIEVSWKDRDWDGHAHVIALAEQGLNLRNSHITDKMFERLSPAQCATEQRGRYSVPDAVRAADFADKQMEEGLFAAILRAKQEEGMPGPRTKTTIPPLNERDARLIQAARSNDAEAVLQALLGGADINARDPKNGRTATHWAAAENALAAVMVLTARDTDAEAVLARYLPGRTLDDAALQAWRKARAARDPLILDAKENCLASAFAPMAPADSTKRGADARAIWQHLMQQEMHHVGTRLGKNPLSVLEIWKPSSVMRKAAKRYGPPRAKTALSSGPEPDPE